LPVPKYRFWPLIDSKFRFSRISDGPTFPALGTNPFPVAPVADKNAVLSKNVMRVAPEFFEKHNIVKTNKNNTKHLFIHRLLSTD
jgi:hypothetical protein